MRVRLALLLTAAATALAQQAPIVTALTAEWPEPMNVDGIEILPVQKNIYMLVGGGKNVTVQIGEGGVMLVDAGGPGQAERIVAAVRTLTRQPLRFLVNTSADADAVGASAGVVQAAGGPIAILSAATDRPANVGILTIAHENTANRMAAAGIEADAVPLSTFFTAKKDFYANGEPVEVLHQPNAHTDGDVFVFFRGSDVVSAGDIFRTDSYPVIDAARGGTIQGEIDALNTLIEIAIPERNQMGGTRIVPGHGRIGNESDVVEYRDMVTIVRDRVRDLVEQNKTVEQVKAARPTLEYDGLYSSPEMSGDRFIELIYAELTGERQ